VLGLINAAAGRYLVHDKLQLGYYFQYEAEGQDLETIYQISSSGGKPTNSAKSNIIYRRFLFNTFLRIYTTDETIAGYFSAPYFQLLLGRMNDLATVINISGKEKLPRVENAREIRGQIIPFKHHVPGLIQALPKYFTNEFPRKNIGTEAYSVIGADSRTFGTDILAFRDILPDGSCIDVYFHDLNF